MNTNKVKKLEKEIIFKRARVSVPSIRNVDFELLELLRQKRGRKDLTWPKMFTEMALDWLKKE